MDNTKNKRAVTLKRKKKGLWLHPPKRFKLTGTSVLDNTKIKSTPNNINFKLTANRSDSELAKTPYKQRQRHKKKRKQLFSPSRDETIAEEIIAIIPSVLNTLQKAGLREDFCLLLKGISSGRFPVFNIALRLLFDVGKWFSLDNTTQMVYSEESMKFWKILYRLFKRKSFTIYVGSKVHGSGYRRDIFERDHFFDTSLRKRKKQRQTKRSDVSKPHEVARGCMPVRQHHKSDESKILPTTRLGIELLDL